mmetsp:Transcript_38516/g.92216  ORF Transcript_38516/g.92216 Transcript_38516/m.92216 type:complete len:180 (+) Transcript_38516:162-701(+)
MMRLVRILFACNIFFPSATLVGARPADLLEGIEAEAAGNPGWPHLDASNSTESKNGTAIISQTPTVTPATTAPTSKQSHEPTKKYESPEKKEEDKEEEHERNVGLIFLYCILAIAGLGILLYFKNPILFFFGSCLANTRLHGLRGCLSSCCPCLFEKQSQQSLDTIIFETDDANAGLLS